MVDVSELVRFAPGDKTLRMAMDIAAAIERYRIVMEGPAGVRLRKLNHVRTIRGTTAIEGNTLTEDQVTGNVRVFVDFMLDMILRTLKARGISRSAIQKHIERLKDAQRLRRVGPDKGGHWQVIEKA